MKRIIRSLTGLLIGLASTVFGQNVWTQLNGPYIGTNSDVAVGFFPGSSTAILYAGDEVYLAKSTNGAASWSYVTAIQYALAVVCEADNPNVVYVGGENGGIIGLYKSNDGGTSWTNVSGTIDNLQFSRIVISPLNRNELYAGMRKRTTNGGLLYHSLDGGATWAEEPAFQDKQFDVADIAFNPQDPREVYLAGRGAVIDPAQNGVYRRDPVQGTWARKVQGMDNPSVSSLAVDSTNPNIVYAGNAFDVVPTTIQLYKSINKGDTWTGIHLESQNDDVYSIAIDRSNPQVVFQSTGSRILKTTDAGSSWNVKMSGLYIGGFRRLVVDRLTPNRVFLGARYAFYKTDNGGENWYEAVVGRTLQTVGGVAARQPYVIANSRLVKGVSTNGGNQWKVVFRTGTSTGEVVFDASDPNYVFSADKTTFGPGPQQPPPIFWGAVRRSTDHGIAWTTVFQLFNPGQVLSVGVDPNNSTIVLAGTEAFTYYLMQSVDRGETWSYIEESGFQGDIRAIAFDPSSAGGSNRSKTIYTGGNLGVRKSVDAGVSWTSMNQGLPADAVVERLIVDPFNSNILYAGTTSYGVYKSSGDEFWFPVNNGISYQNISALKADPRVQGLIYAASNESGSPHVYLSNDGGSNWSEVTGSLSPVVNDLAIDPTDPLPYVYAATNAGVYRYLPNSWQGTITQNTTWSGTVFVVGDLEVASGVKLTVNPGTQVRVFNGVNIRISGKLTAKGTSTQRITFLSSSASPTRGIWNRIGLYSGPDTLQHCTIKHATYGIYVNNSSTNLIDNCIVDSCSNSAIHVVSTGSAEGSCVIRNSSLQRSLRGLGLVNAPLVNVSYCYIQDNYTLDGINLLNSLVYLDNCQIQNNAKKGLYVSAGLTGQAKFSPDGTEQGCNSVKNNGTGEIYIASGSGTAWLGQFSPPGTLGGYNNVYNSLTSPGRLITNYNTQQWSVFAHLCYWGNGAAGAFIGPVDTSYRFTQEQCVGLAPIVLKDKNETRESSLADDFLKSGYGIEPLSPRIGNWITFWRLEVETSAPHARSALHSLATFVGPSGRYPNALGMSWEDFLQGVENTSGSPELRSLASAYRVQSRMDVHDHNGALQLVNAVLSRNPDDNLWMYCQEEKVVAFLGLGNVQGARGVYESMRERALGIDSSAVELLLSVIAVAESDVTSGPMTLAKSLAERPLSASSPELLSFELEQNYPNPFNPTTSLRYQLPRNSRVLIKLYDVLGREVMTVVDEQKEAGNHEALLDVSNLASGVYFYKMVAGEFVAVRKLVVMK